MKKNSEQLSKENTLSEMDSLWTYCKEGKFTDIRIICQGGVLDAHKAMLSLTMPVLQLLDADMILMPDTSVQFLESELQKLYETF